MKKLSTLSDKNARTSRSRPSYVQKSPVKIYEWKRICACDSLKPTDAISISTQCLCEEIEYGKELTLYFFEGIVKSRIVEEYVTNKPKESVSWVNIKEQQDESMSQTTYERKDIRKLSQEDLKKTLYGAGGNQIALRKSHSGMKALRTSRSQTKNKKAEKTERRRESVAKKASDTQPNGSTRPGSVSGHRRSVPGSIGSKALPSYDQNIDQASSLQPITEDNLMDTTEKLISTTNFDYDWLVKRDEVFAKIIFKNGNIYEGDVLDKLPHGKGTFWWADGTFYEGEFDNGEPTGTGTMRLPDLTEYTGGFRRGYFHGNGVYNMRTTNMLYSGGWKFGKKEGEGWLLYEPGVWYEGEFRNDLREGKGFSQFKDGSCYEGHYVKNKREGYGAMRWFNNDIYIGNWSNGIIHGFGEYSWKTVFNNTFSFPVQHYYKGSWENGRRTGTGVMFFGLENGAKMAGIFQDNFKHGAAVVVCGNGRSVEKNPLFHNDKPVHKSVSEEDMQKDSSSSTFNDHIFQKVVKTGFADKQWPTKPQVSQVTSQLLEYANQEKGALCNPIEIQIHSSPEDVDLNFYIEQALGMYINAFDTIQFDLESTDSSSNSTTSKIQWSKWNLLTLSSAQHSKANKSGAQETPIVYGRCSVNQGGPSNNFNKSDSKFQSTIRSEEKYLRNVIIRYLPKLMEVYYHYATITSPTKVYFKHYMIRMFLWQIYLDVGLTELGISLVEVDRLLDENPASYVETCHHPFEHIYFFQFIQSLMGTALLVHYKSREEVHSSEGLTPYIFQKFLTEILFVRAGSHRGRCLFEFKNLLPIKNVYSLYMKLGEPLTARTFLKAVCTKKGEDPPCYKAWFTKNSEKVHLMGRNVNTIGHNFLYIPEPKNIGEPAEDPKDEIDGRDPFFRDLSTFRHLGPKVIVKCLYTVCPPIAQNHIICNMSYPMTFLEFYEVLICCALLNIARQRKQIEIMKKLNIKENKNEDNDDQDSLSRKNSARIKKRK